nr:response regulator [Anaplasma marginale]
MNKSAIICVDDEKMVLVSLKNQLIRNLGNTRDIVLAESAAEALEIFEELEKDKIEIPVIICDRIMSDMKGEDLLSKIHEKYT